MLSSAPATAPPAPPSSDEDFFSTASTSTSSDSKPPSPSATPSSALPQIPIAWPDDGVLNVSWVTNLMQAFEWASRAIPPSELPSVLPVKVLDKLVLTASKILHKEPNCVKIEENSGLVSESRVVVVGDVHGQLHDVLFLLRDAGFPADDRFFVFNGDYVDRGAWGLEVFLLLLAWKVLMPHRVYLLRGNHESKYCTAVYGFEKEVATKYGDSGKHVYRKCLGCFEGLPLASIIAGKVYTAHGGLFRGTVATPSKRSKKKNRKVVHNPVVTSLILGSLEELAKARRSVLDPPWEGPNLIPGDVLWSDPSVTPGLSPNKERGIGLLWGPDCTEEFLKKYNLKLIIRSHEGPDARDKRSDLKGMGEGYTIDHIVESGKLITLFSAPDYPQFQATETRYKNKGAYIVLEPPHFDTPIFHSFEAVTQRPKVNPYYDFEEVIDSDEELDMVSMVPESGEQETPA
ncbi:Serine-threonine phosphatase 2A, catalytic subunit [Handroanthus impetiginosus]|uniref:Serine/threonine-protein phosphatase n=1 Tax=Handroanthus impetiginosus TaxID=429701 RepID=A0A2G9FXW0_9LAMI|nr:Serine-threonine phosphatase 2A, catalytic subunit [Handroanthus impetiginosus]